MLEKLKNANSLSDLAVLLGYKPSALSFILYKRPAASNYATFDLPKKGGGTRTIDAPHPKLRVLQARLAELLTECRLELEKNTPKRAPLSHGFRKRHSIVTNATPHKKQRYVLNLDLENFFPTFNFGRVRGFFIKNRDFQLHPSVATVIAQIACYKNSLPQGSPCSPIISDLIGHILDVRLVQIARKYSCIYTRYADDLTFSTSQKVFPKELAFQSFFSAQWEIGEKIKSEIEKSGFRINRKKTRMQRWNGRQAVTGLTVNQKANIHANYYRFARAMTNQMFSTGSYFKPDAAKTILKGRKFAKRNLFVKFFRWALELFPRTRLFVNVKTSKPKYVGPLTSLDKLEGMLNHIYYVKREAAKRAALSRRTPNKKDRFEKSAIESLYEKFLFFKLFVALRRPLIVCEGKTDNVYLRVALRALGAKYPDLYAPASSMKAKILLFNHNSTVKHLLDLSGGSGGLASLIKKYGNFLPRYQFRPLGYPVIILIDNDQGADPVFKAVDHQFKLKIDYATDQPFYHLFENLYLIKTPASNSAKNFQSCIEDLLDPTLFKVELNGCKFNPHKEHNADGEYGKAAFAKDVVAARSSSIDFSNFSAIFDRVQAVLNHYVPPT